MTWIDTLNPERIFSTRFRVHLSNTIFSTVWKSILPSRTGVLFYNRTDLSLKSSNLLIIHKSIQLYWLVSVQLFPEFRVISKNLNTL